MTGVRSLAVGHAFVIGGLESDSERQLEVGGTGAVAADLFEGFPIPHSVTYIGPKRSAAPPCAIRARGRGGHRGRGDAKGVARRDRHRVLHPVGQPKVW